MPPGWHAPALWLRQATCIHNGTDWRTGRKDIYVNGHLFSGEGAWNSIGYVHGIATYGGGMQFLVSTWQAAGGREGSVWAIARSPVREQLYRAYLTWDRTAGRPHDGVGSWSQWGTAAACGLK